MLPLQSMIEKQIKRCGKYGKLFSQLVIFDSEIRPIVEYFGLPPLPDKQLFVSSTPAKLKREDWLYKIILIQYLSCLIFHEWFYIIFVDFIIRFC